MKKKSTILRELIEADEILLMVLIAVPFFAQLVEKAGFPAVGISGSGSAAYTLGLPDAGLITMSEVVENAQRVCNVVDIPVLADCDTGFGNAINVRRTVESIIRTGAAGLFIEDQVAPKRCGFVKGKQVIPIEEAVGKYRAAVDIRNEMDPDFIIMARCDARGVAGGSMEEVIRRGKAYREAGVDIIYAEALQSREEIKQLRAGLDGPLKVTTQAIEPMPTLQELQDLGMAMYFAIITSVGPVTIWDMLVDMKQRGIDPFIEYWEKTKDHPLGGHGVFDVTGFGKVAEWEKKYLSPERLAEYDETLGLYDPRTPGQLGR